MKMVLSRLFFLMVVFGSALPAVAEDTWPSWRGPRGDGSRPDKVVPLKWSVEKNTVWKTPLPGKGHASPVITQGQWFLRGAEHLFCIGLKCLYIGINALV